jgi:hypothetical protein
MLRLTGIPSFSCHNISAESTNGTRYSIEVIDGIEYEKKPKLVETTGSVINTNIPSGSMPTIDKKYKDE